MDNESRNRVTHPDERELGGSGTAGIGRLAQYGQGPKSLPPAFGTLLKQDMALP